MRVTGFRPRALPPFLEGAVKALRAQPSAREAARLHRRVRESALFDPALGRYKVNAPLASEPFEIGRARAFTPGWLENESIWLHMEYKYLLEMLRAGLYDEFFGDLRACLTPFQDPGRYGRSPLENCSFLASSAHLDPALHGAGFVARLSGSTAEFLSMWNLMTAGPRPFSAREGHLFLALRPALPAWLFDASGSFQFRFLGRCEVTLRLEKARDLRGARARRAGLVLEDGRRVEMEGGILGEPYSRLVREGKVKSLQLWMEADEGLAGVESLEKAGGARR